MYAIGGIVTLVFVFGFMFFMFTPYRMLAKNFILKHPLPFLYVASLIVCFMVWSSVLHVVAKLFFIGFMVFKNLELTFVVYKKKKSR